MPLFQARYTKGLLLAVLTSFTFHAHAQRLPQTVHPEHYQLTLTPNLKDATFAGSEKIDVLLDHPLDSITLNAAEIKFQGVTAKVDGKELKATVTEDAGNGAVTHFGHWVETDGQVKVSFDPVQGTPAEPPMTLQAEHDGLRAIAWNHTTWGKATPPVLKSRTRVKQRLTDKSAAEQIEGR